MEKFQGRTWFHSKWLLPFSICPFRMQAFAFLSHQNPTIRIPSIGLPYVLIILSSTFLKLVCSFPPLPPFAYIVADTYIWPFFCSYYYTSKAYLKASKSVPTSWVTIFLLILKGAHFSNAPRCIPDGINQCYRCNKYYKEERGSKMKSKSVCQVTQTQTGITAAHSVSGLVKLRRGEANTLR